MSLVGANDDAAGTVASRVSFSAAAGTVYSIAVDGFGGYEGDIQLHLWSGPLPPAIAGQPQSGTVLCQWFFNGAPLPNQTNSSLTLTQVSRANSGSYSVVVSNSAGNWTEFSGTVRVLVPPVLQAPEIEPNGTVRLLFQDEDGGLPFDVSKTVVQWRNSLPSGSDTNWQSLVSSFLLTNGFEELEDTNAAGQPSSFYRVLEQ